MPYECWIVEFLHLLDGQGEHWRPSRLQNLRWAFESERDAVRTLRSMREILDMKFYRVTRYVEAN